uniref:ANK_REP_REGION domain-containing protein n=1 Tax=Macrostomum lignano TaxID=282301 RepID=A0A1I8FI04_9PLAT
MAAERGQTKIVELLIDKFKCNVLARHKDGSTLMHVTSESGFPETNHGLSSTRSAAAHAEQERRRRVCLHAAAKSGHTPAFLLEKGANVNAVTKDRLTALHEAVARGHPAVVETPAGLRGAGAAKQRFTTLRNCPKDKAGGDFDDTDLVKLLLRYEGDISVPTKFNCGDAAALLFCARSGNEDILLEIVKFLDHRIPLVVNRQSSHTQNRTNRLTPSQIATEWLVAFLLIASDCGREGIVQILLKKHARVDVFDTKGFAALGSLAAKNTTTPYQGVLHTLLHLAAQEGHNEVVKLLLKQDGVEVESQAT